MDCGLACSLLCQSLSTVEITDLGKTEAKINGYTQTVILISAYHADTLNRFHASLYGIKYMYKRSISMAQLFFVQLVYFFFTSTHDFTITM